MVTARRYFWEIISSELLHQEKLSNEDLYARLFEDGADLPESIESELISYFGAGEKKRLLNAASDAVKTFFLASEIPEEHLVLVAFLLHVQAISPELANELARLDPSNFSLMGEAATDLVRIADMVAEEHQMGIKAVAADNFLESNLMKFAESKGFKFESKESN